MTNKNSFIENYNNYMQIVLTSHGQVKINTNLAYQEAVKHGINFGDWYLLADFITKMLINNVMTAKHLFNILKNTNDKLIYNRSKASIKQGKDFDKNNTVIIEELWTDQLTESKKQASIIFDSQKLTTAIQNLIKKAVKNNITKKKIKNLLIAESKKI